MKAFDPLQEILGYSFRKKDLLRDALTHRSFLNERHRLHKGQGGQDNERLEFLGDAVLDLAISEHLIHLYPLSSEGDLSKMKARIVRETTLARVARGLTLGEFLLLGKGEERTHGREKSSLLADALEAVIAAIYLDGGFETARAVLLGIFKDEIQRLEQHRGEVDFKTELQEYCQREFGVLPSYRVLRETGPDHKKLFEVNLSVRGKVLGTGHGKSKKVAEQQAAKQAIEKLAKKP